MPAGMGASALAAAAGLSVRADGNGGGGSDGGGDGEETGEAFFMPDGSPRHKQGPHARTSADGVSGCTAGVSGVSGVSGTMAAAAPPPPRPVNIIVTQPRRVAAVTLARRVAEERGERLGRTVGYRIGMEACASHVTKITFATVGFLLQQLVHRPDRLDQYSHIILDEVHERDMDTDLVCLIIKRALQQQRQQPAAPAAGGGAGGGAAGAAVTTATSSSPFRLILMSATFDTSIFSDYFADGTVPCMHAQQQLLHMPRMPPAAESGSELGSGSCGGGASDGGSDVLIGSLFVGVKRFTVHEVHLEDVLDAVPALHHNHGHRGGSAGKKGAGGQGGGHTNPRAIQKWCTKFDRAAARKGGTMVWHSIGNMVWHGMAIWYGAACR